MAVRQALSRQSVRIEFVVLTDKNVPVCAPVLDVLDAMEALRKHDAACVVVRRPDNVVIAQRKPMQQRWMPE